MVVGVDLRDSRLTCVRLTAFLACPHLTLQQIAIARGELTKPFRANLHADLIAATATTTRRPTWRALAAEVTTIELDGGGFDAAARATDQAMRRRARDRPGDLLAPVVERPRGLPF